MPYLNNDEVRNQTRELWRTCFGDPEPFLDLYFTRKYTPASNVCIIHERQVVSALQAFLYPMSFYGTVVRVGYLSGVATHPDHRGKGLASRIIDEAHRRLAKAGALMSFVIPADEELFGFYERHGGYQTAVYRAEVDVTDSLDDVPPQFEVEEPEEEAQEIYTCYRNIRRRTDLALCHDRSSFFTALAAWRQEGHIFCTVRRGGQLAGLCFARRRDKEQCEVAEALARTDEALDAMIHHVRRRLGVKRATMRVGASGNMPDARPYAMARVLDAPRFLRLVQQANPNLTLDVGIGGDWVLPSNNAFYHLANGRLTLTGQMPSTLTTSGGLARMFLAGQPVQLKLMMDE